MDNVPQLGSVLKTEQERDAIHIAIAPIVASEKLRPGQHVGINGNSTDPIGIVDPLLKKTVLMGERFWLFLYPNTITSLRHDWTHPAFLAEAKLPHEMWMRDWAMTHMSYDYDVDHVTEDMAYAAALEIGRSLSVGCNENALDYIDDEWWTHWEAITGERGQRGEYFSCAC